MTGTPSLELSLRQEPKQLRPFGGPEEEAGLNLARTAAWLTEVREGVLKSHGVTRRSPTCDQLTTMMARTTSVPMGLVRLTGLTEVLGALGVLLPSLTRIRPAFTPLAATGLVAVMALAAVFHPVRGDRQPRAGARAGRPDRLRGLGPQPPRPDQPESLRKGRGETSTACSLPV